MAPVQRLPMSSIARWKRVQTGEISGESVMLEIYGNLALDTSYLLKYINQSTKLNYSWPLPERS